MATCSGPTTPQSCISGYYLSSGQCYPCSAIAYGWETCASGATLLTCIPGTYKATTTVCRNCSQVNPFWANCTSSPLAATLCISDSYILGLGTCTLCSVINPTWLTCSGTRPTPMTCQVGYYMDYGAK